MNQTTNTGLFIFLTLFLLLVSVFGGHFLANNVPNITATTIMSDLYSSNTSTNGTMTLWQYMDYARQHPNLHQSYAQYLLTKNIPGFDWLSATVTFMAAMFSFKIEGLEAISIFWWFLSALWLWLIVNIIRGVSS